MKTKARTVEVSFDIKRLSLEGVETETVCISLCVCVLGYHLFTLSGHNHRVLFATLLLWDVIVNHYPLCQKFVDDTVPPIVPARSFKIVI